MLCLSQKALPFIYIHILVTQKKKGMEFIFYYFIMYLIFFLPFVGYWGLIFIHFSFCSFFPQIFPSFYLPHSFIPFPYPSLSTTPGGGWSFIIYCIKENLFFLLPSFSLLISLTHPIRQRPLDCLFKSSDEGKSKKKRRKWKIYENYINIFCG